MENRCSKFLVLMAVVAVFFSGCKKSDDSPASSYNAPSVGTAAAITLPSTISTSTAAGATIASYASMANSFSSMGAYLSNIPSNATVSDLKSTGKSYTWTSTYNNQTYTIWIDFTNDGVTKTWKLYYQGSTYFTTKTLIVTVTELVTGTGGTVTYDLSAYGGTGKLIYTWTKTSTGVTGTLAYGTSYFMSITSNTDHSGSLVVYSGTSATGTKEIEVTWKSTGSGTWYIRNNTPTTGTF